MPRPAVVRAAGRRCGVLLLLMFVLGGPAVSHACDPEDTPSCTCEPGPPPPPPEYNWVSESTVGTGASSTCPAASATVSRLPRNWKLFPDKFQDLVREVRTGRRPASDLHVYLLGLVGMSTFLFALIACLVVKGIASRDIRRLFQILFLVLWVFVFAQCLCGVKDMAVLVAYAVRGKFLYGLCTAWLAILSIGFVLLLGRRFRSFYCFWACPVGTAQDLLETGLHRRMSDRLKLALLAVLAVVLVGGVALRVPRPLNLVAGPALALLMIVFAALGILRPALNRFFRRFVFLSMGGWFLLNLVVMLCDIENKTPGPWCVPGVANLRHPLVLTFLVLLAVSMIVPRAWCNFVCPNRGLFEALSGKRKSGERGGKPDDEQEVQT